MQRSQKKTSSPSCYGAEVTVFILVQGGVDTGKAPISFVYMSVAPPKHEVMKNTFNRDINSACAQTGEFSNKKGESWAA